MMREDPPFTDIDHPSDIADMGGLVAVIRLRLPLAPDLAEAIAHDIEYAGYRRMPQPEHATTVEVAS